MSECWAYDDTYRYGDHKPNGYACRDSESSLAVMLACEYGWILQRSIGAHDSELRASEDGVGLEAGPLQKGAWVEGGHLGGDAKRLLTSPYKTVT